MSNINVPALAAGLSFALYLGGINPSSALAAPRSNCWMTGGGSVFSADGIVDIHGHNDGRVTHGFEIHCDPRRSDNLEINWSGGRFKLDQITSAICTDDPAITPNPPDAEFDTYNGIGEGDYCVGGNCVAAQIIWTFTDAGEGGLNDTATIQIIVNGNTVLNVTGFLAFGNHQAHSN